MNSSLEFLRIKAHEAQKKANGISKDIKDLEAVLKTACILEEKVYWINDDFSVYWCPDKKRLMSKYNRNHRPLIEQPLEARIKAHEDLENLVKFFNGVI